MTTDELERIVTIIQNPLAYKIPTWFLNSQRAIVDGKNSQVLANQLDNKLREDLERLKKIRAHRGLRHFWGLRVRGQVCLYSNFYRLILCFSIQKQPDGKERQWVLAENNFLLFFCIVNKNN